MSTKSTLRYGNSFHLYTKAFEDDAMYLELEGCSFIASEKSVTVRIPLAIWEHIRAASIADSSLAPMSDASLEEFVRKKHAAYLKNVAKGGHFALIGIGVWGKGSAAQTFKRGLKWFAMERRRQRKLQAEIAQLKAAEAKPTGKRPLSKPKRSLSRKSV